MNRKKSAFAPSRSRVQRFRETIRKQGPNPYVDIPERVRCAFADYARVGHISVEGKLNQTAIRGTLIPVGTGGYPLYFNGGMRSAAGVTVGDRVSLELRATRPDAVRPPSDVAAV